MIRFAFLKGHSGCSEEGRFKERLKAKGKNIRRVI